MFEKPAGAAPRDEAVVEGGAAEIYLRAVGDAWIIGTRPAAVPAVHPSVEISEKFPAPSEPSPYLTQDRRLLRDACHAMRKDDNGRHCPRCNVRDFCEDQARRAVEEAAP